MNHFKTMLSKTARIAVLAITVAVMALMSDAFGQNKPLTAGEFDPSVFKQRRQQLLDSLKEGTAILYSRGEETDMGYRSDGDFWYLTGLDEPGAILMLSPMAEWKEILFLPPRDVEVEKWIGWRPDITDSLIDAWGFDKIFRIDGSFDGFIITNIRQSSILHLISALTAPSDPISPDMELYGKIAARIPEVSIRNSSRYLENMRVIKSPGEVEAVRRAIDITYQGLTELFTAMKPGVTEFYLDGVLDASFKRQGTRFAAFDNLIAAGKNGVVLHYQRLGDTLRDGDLLLVDVGAEYRHYAADISRTIPISGKFGEEQARLYDLVYEAQQAAIAAVKPGVSFNDLDDAAKAVIGKAGYAKYVQHSVGHQLGVEVHDRNNNQRLEPGMIITIEPGIYLYEKGIGIRIEDDLLVTKTGCEVLSSSIPGSRPEIEAWLASLKQEK